MSEKQRPQAAELSEPHRLRLTLARRLLDRARGSVDESGLFGPWHSVVEACDAAELVLLVVAAVKKIHVPEQTTFGELMKKLRSSVPTVGENSSELFRISTHRNAAKHKGIVPSPTEARTVVESAVVVLHEIAKKELGGGLDHASMSGWLEHRLLADALDRAAAELEERRVAEDPSDFLCALGEARHYCVRHALWLIGVDHFGRRAGRMEPNAREKYGSDDDKYARDLLHKVVEEVERLEEQVAMLRAGVPGEDATLWSGYLPNVAITGSGKVHCVTGFRPVPDEAARRLLSSLSSFALRLDGRHPQLRPEPSGYVRVTREVEAMRGSGESRMLAAVCRPGKRYERTSFSRREESVARLRLFGIDVEVPADAIQPYSPHEQVEECS